MFLLTTEWKSVIFSDKKKFNLDGPDGFKYYWHHINIKELSYSTRVMGGGGIMVWIGFCDDKKLSIQIINNKMNSLEYCSMLNRSLKCFVDENNNKDYIFQQDNAPCHRAKNTKLWLESNRIYNMSWPALSPDLNLVENIWSDMSKVIYGHGKQCNSLQELNTAILIAWASMPDVKLSNYINGMQKRMLELILKKGDKIIKKEFKIIFY